MKKGSTVKICCPYFSRKYAARLHAEIHCAKAGRAAVRKFIHLDDQMSYFRPYCAGVNWECCETAVELSRE